MVHAPTDEELAAETEEKLGGFASLGRTLDAALLDFEKAEMEMNDLWLRYNRAKGGRDKALKALNETRAKVTQVMEKRLPK